MSTDGTAPPAITVLLPTHNGGSHLRASVLSVLAQTHRDFELLVIDDGSTDGSERFVGSLADDRVRLVQQENRGLVATLNRGLAEARGDVIARMDADDVCAPRRLELQLRFLQTHLDVAAVGCCYEVVDENGSPSHCVHTAAGPDYLERQLYFRNVLPHPGMMFRREAVLAVGGYRDVAPVEDYDLWIRLSAKRRLASIPDILLKYRVPSEGIGAPEQAARRAGTKVLRDELHRSRPIAIPSARAIARLGANHAETYRSSCPEAGRNYVFDHIWLAIHLGRRRRFVAAARVLAGTVLLFLSRPTVAGGLVDVLRRA